MAFHLIQSGGKTIKTSKKGDEKVETNENKTHSHEDMCVWLDSASNFIVFSASSETKIRIYDMKKFSKYFCPIKESHVRVEKASLM